MCNSKSFIWPCCTRRIDVWEKNDVIPQNGRLFTRKQCAYFGSLKQNPLSKNNVFNRLFPSSGVLGSRSTLFRKLDLFPSSGEGRGRKQIQFLKRRLSTPKNTGRWKKLKTPVILRAIRHCQNTSS
jgi:hypothetical protein